MKRCASSLALLLGCSCVAVRANESAASEMSHFLSGALIASAATVVADHYAVEQRGWVGFWTSVGVSFVSETVQVMTSSSSTLRGPALDFAYNLAGAALGAWVTDCCILQPVVVRDAAGHRTIGIALQARF